MVWKKKKHVIKSHYKSFLNEYKFTLRNLILHTLVVRWVCMSFLLCDFQVSTYMYMCHPNNVYQNSLNHELHLKEKQWTVILKKWNFFFFFPVSNFDRMANESIWDDWNTLSLPGWSPQFWYLEEMFLQLTGT